MTARCNTMPGYLVETLEANGCRIVSHVLLNGVGHPYIQFQCPRGTLRKWSWPRVGKSDIRALKNNRSELKRFVKGITQ